MPRNRTPSNILDLRGSFKKHPERKRERVNEPKDQREVGKPPRGLTKDVRAAWRELVDCAIPGVLTYADRPAVLAAAQLYARMKDQRGQHETRRNELTDLVEGLDFTNEPAVRGALIDIIDFADQCSTFRPSDQANLTRLLSLMGMTPADRSKIIVPKDDDANPFDDD